MNSSEKKPLDGLVVLDLTHMLSGPYGTMLLTDLGARTIKVEPPGTGEGTRTRNKVWQFSMTSSDMLTLSLTTFRRVFPSDFVSIISR